MIQRTKYGIESSIIEFYIKKLQMSWRNEKVHTSGDLLFYQLNQMHWACDHQRNKHFYRLHSNHLIFVSTMHSCWNNRVCSFAEQTDWMQLQKSFVCRLINFFLRSAQCEVSVPEKLSFFFKLNNPLNWINVLYSPTMRFNKNLAQFAKNLMARFFFFIFELQLS